MAKRNSEKKEHPFYEEKSLIGLPPGWKFTFYDKFLKFLWI